MTGRPDDSIDWSQATWKGSRLQQHRAFFALPFGRKLELIEEMSETVAFFASKPSDPPGTEIRENLPPS